MSAGHDDEFYKANRLRHLNIREAIQAVISGKIERIEFSETVNLKLLMTAKRQF
jgi:hypothetical protein